MRWIVWVMAAVSLGCAKPLIIALQDRGVEAVVIVAIEKKFF